LNIVEELIARKGLVPNLTSRLNETQRNKWKEKYKNLKKGTIVVSLGALTVPETKLLLADLAALKLKIYGYKTALAVLAGPFIQMVSVPLYIIGRARTLRLLAITLSDLGSKITAGEMSMMNWIWVGAYLVLFGEPVPIVNSTDFMILKNESSVVDEFLNALEE
jgi:hypothetical protein